MQAQPFNVYTRIRPLNQKEIVYGYNKKCIQRVDHATISVSSDDRNYNQTIFQVDRVFGQEQDNESIFTQTVVPLADNFLNGINSTIFAYGITGAGKSYTMFGKNKKSQTNIPSHQPGLIQMALSYICDELNNSKDSENISYQLQLSYLQIYNQQVYDLFNSNPNQKSQNLQILDDPVSGVIVYDLRSIQINTANQALELIEQGNQRRVIAETKANQFSSRSHAIVQVSLQKTVGDIILNSKFSLVDLAGSQKQNVYSENKGIRNFQGSNINRSLLTLGNCITMLSNKKNGFIPYRDSKLTRLLKDSLGGNTKTAMIACVSPSFLTFQETLNTMKYACRARKIEKVVNQNIREQRSNEQLKKQLSRVKKQMQYYKQIIQNKGQGHLIQNNKDKLSYMSTPANTQEIRSLIQKLIKNTEQLTLLRLKQSNSNECTLSFADKVRQLQLIDNQTNITNSIVKYKSNQVQYNSNQNKQAQPLNIINQNHMHLYKHKNHNKEHSNQTPLQISISSHHIKTQKTLPSQSKKLPYSTPKLQNIREKNRQQKLQLKELILSYYESYEQDGIRQQIIQKANIFLSKTKESSKNNPDFTILNKILQGQRLSTLDLNLCIGEVNMQKLSREDGYSNDDITIDGVQAKKQTNNNRFLNSLQQIRKITRKLSNKADAICQEMYTVSYQDGSYQRQNYNQRQHSQY